MPGSLRRHIDLSALRDVPLFTTSEARDAGISGHDLALLVRRELIWRPAQGWYSCLPDVTEDERHVLRTVTALRVHGPGAVACRVSALILHGLPVARCDLSVVEIATTGGGHGRTRRGVRVSQLPSKGAAPVRIAVPLVDADIPVVDVPTAIVGAARCNSAPGALVAADFAVGQGMCTLEDIAASLKAHAGSTGIERARAWLADIDPRHESAGETLTAVILRQRSWEFEPQLWVRAGGRNCRLDFALTEYKVAIEFDGESKYTGPEVMEDQLARQAALEAEGWVFVRLGWADLDDPTTLLRRIAEAVAMAEAR